MVPKHPTTMIQIPVASVPALQRLSWWCQRSHHQDASGVKVDSLMVSNFKDLLLKFGQTLQLKKATLDFSMTYLHLLATVCWYFSYGKMYGKRFKLIKSPQLDVVFFAWLEDSISLPEIESHHLMLPSKQLVGRLIVQESCRIFHICKLWVVEPQNNEPFQLLPALAPCCLQQREIVHTCKQRIRP